MKKITALLFASLVASLSLIPVYVQAALPAFDSQGDALPTLAPMLEHATPAVVNIATKGKVQIKQNPLFNDPFFRRFFDIPNQPREREIQSLGSGVVIDAKKGYIITNNHVIESADEIQVTLRNGEVHQAKLLGTDPETDIAVIQIKAENLTALPLANSSKTRVGDFVVAIGNPFGLGQTVTSGIVSAVGRSGLGIEGYENFIQTDASINPGNSGGALVNLRGELVGINTAIFSQSGGNIGIGFAIPINMVADIKQQLLKYGEVQRGRLGAQAQDLNPQLAKAFNIKINRGAVITQVVAGSAAEKSGLRAGDIVTHINGKVVKNADTLRNSVGLLRVGQKVEMKILREGKAKTLVAKIEKHSEQNLAGKQVHPQLMGAHLSDIDESSRYYGRVKGVLIADIDPDSQAWRNSLRKGDIITSVNRKSVNSLNELHQLTQKSRSLLLNIRRGNGALFLYLQ